MVISAMPDAALLNRLRAIAGDRGYLEGTDTEPYLRDARDLYEGATPIVLRPGTTRETADIVAACAAAGVSIVPQGGNTGYCGGSIPDDNGEQIVLSLSRMNRIRDVDPANDTMTVESGCVLASVQEAAEAVDRLFPLSLGAEGSCQIGGNLSTNAGGIAVLRYGNMRDLVLGLEAILPDGSVWNGLRRLRKDNTGYDLKHLFIGAEGTLGIITAAVLKLFPKPGDSVIALVAIPDPAAALALLSRLRVATGDSVDSFEYIHRHCIDLVLEHVEDTTDPLEAVHPHYALFECGVGGQETNLTARIEETLAGAFEDGQILDATIATSARQADALWRLRETIPEAQKNAGAGLKHDVSVPLTAVATFLERATAETEIAVPGARVIPFGHMGDGNIHFNISRDPATDGATLFDKQHAIETTVHDIAVDLGGSFSAEHGIGQLKKHELTRYKSNTELDLMKTVKDAIDPEGLMNPGKLF